MKRVFSSHDLVAVHHARNLLDVAGLRCVVRNELLSSAMGELPPAECQAELWIVNDADAERADTIVRLGHIPSEQKVDPWRCSECDEPAEPQFTQCWRCGTYRMG